MAEWPRSRFARWFVGGLLWEILLRLVGAGAVALVALATAIAEGYSFPVVILITSLTFGGVAAGVNGALALMERLRSRHLVQTGLPGWRAKCVFFEDPDRMLLELYGPEGGEALRRFRCVVSQGSEEYFSEREDDMDEHRVALIFPTDFGVPQSASFHGRFGVRWTAIRYADAYGDHYRDSYRGEPKQVLEVASATFTLR